MLRGQLGFRGLIVSDYFAVHVLAEYHHVASDKAEAAHLALEASIDIELPSTDCYGTPLKPRSPPARSPKRFDEVVGRVLAMKFRVGLFDKVLVDPEQAAHVFDTPAQRDLAPDVACKSIVLLKNTGDMQALRKDLSSIAVLGPNADNVRHQMGDYSYPAHIETLLEMHGQPGQLPMSLPARIELADIEVAMVSVLDGIRSTVGPRTEVRHAHGRDVLGNSHEGFAEAVAAARGAEVAIVVVGDKGGLTYSCSSGESRDRAELHLPGSRSSWCARSRLPTRGS